MNEYNWGMPDSILFLIRRVLCYNYIKLCYEEKTWNTFQRELLRTS